VTSFFFVHKQGAIFGNSRRKL